MNTKRKGSCRCLVAKFGGSSLADESRVSKAAEAVAKEVSKGTKVAVVVSAMGKTTDLLMNTTEQACKGKISNNDLDDILSMGERTSARIFSAALRAKEVRCRHLDPSYPIWPIITDGSFTNAKPILQECERLVREHVLPLLEDGVVTVIPGFIGRTEDGRITTMGRGGSDTTAMIVARALQADQVVLVTDVDGIMSADPKVIKNPQRLKEIDVGALTGLADSGTKFIHKKALKYKDPAIGIKVINYTSGDFNSEGTMIRGGLPNNVTVGVEYPSPAMAVTVVGDAVSGSPRILQEVFQEVRDAGLPILGVSMDYNSFILYLPEVGTGGLLEALHSTVVDHKEPLAMAVRRNLAFIKVKGMGLEETPGIISRLAEALYSEGINIFGIFTIASSVLVFVDSEQKEKAVELIRKSIKVKKR